MTSPSRSTATMEALVRVRALVSPSLRFDVRRPGRDGDLLGEQTGGLLAEPGELTEHQRRAEDVGQGLGLVVGQRNVRLAGVGVVGVVENEITAAVAVGDDAQAASGLRHQIVTYPDPG